jgi:hypothetical protein
MQNTTPDGITKTSALSLSRITMVTAAALDVRANNIPPKQRYWQIVLAN